MANTALRTVLLVEDDKMIREMTREYLQKSNYIILEAISVERGLNIVKQHAVDAVLLDLHLDGEMSLPSIPQFKAHQDIPVLVVSGEKDDKKKILSFELGADDFVEKPFNPELLKARLQSHIKKTSAAKPLPAQPRAFGDWRLDTSQMQLLHKNEKSAGLTVSEFHVLKNLIENAGKVIKREDLCESLRKDNYVPTPRAIDIKITRIRKKIEQPAEQDTPIKTLRGVGYIFDQTALKEK